MSGVPITPWNPCMHRFLLLIVLASALAGCSLVDAGIARQHCPRTWEFGEASAYAEFAWPANPSLLRADLLGGANRGTLVSLDLWRLLHLELGLLGVGVGIGPLQVGAGAGFYAPQAPATMEGWCPFTWDCCAQGCSDGCGTTCAAPSAN